MVTVPLLRNTAFLLKKEIKRKLALLNKPSLIDNKTPTYNIQSHGLIKLINHLLEISGVLALLCIKFEEKVQKI